MDDADCDARLETGRLLLNPLTDDDLNAVFDLFACETVSSGFGQDRLCDIEQARYWLDVQRWRQASGGGLTWCLRLKQNGAVVGTAGFDCINRLWHNADICYALHPDYWGQGLMFEALSGLIAYAFSGALGCPIHRVEALVMPGNRRSVRVLRKLGFGHEGLRRGLVFWQGRYRDADGYALLNPSD
jgi:[ribosomal protein S5]-alanine N-acetyltransferase